MGADVFLSGGGILLIWRLEIGWHFQTLGHVAQSDGCPVCSQSCPFGIE